MKNIRIDDTTHDMLKEISPRKDSIGVSATMTKMIRDSHKDHQAKN